MQIARASLLSQCPLNVCVCFSWGNNCFALHPVLMKTSNLGSTSFLLPCWQPAVSWTLSIGQNGSCSVCAGVRKRRAVLPAQRCSGESLYIVSLHSCSCARRRDTLGVMGDHRGVESGLGRKSSQQMEGLVSGLDPCELWR